MSLMKLKGPLKGGKKPNFAPVLPAQDGASEWNTYEAASGVEGILVYSSDCQSPMYSDGSEYRNVGNVARELFVQRDAVQSISDDTWTAVTFNSSSSTEFASHQDADGTTIWSSSNAHILLPVGFTRVRIEACIQFDADATGDRFLRLRKWATGPTVTQPNGYPTIGVPASILGEDTGVQLAGNLELSAGEGFQLEVKQTSGGSLDVNNGVSTYLKVFFS